MPRNPSRTLPRAETLIAGPFRGMRDAPEATTTDLGLALYAGNMLRTPGPTGGGMTGRPGFDPMGSTALGTVGVRTAQAMLTWTDVNGVRITTAIVGGLLYTYNWSTGVWTNSVTTANLTTNSVTLSTTARVALVPFADGLVVSDGVNTPFWWNGAAGAGGIVKMTSAPVFYGPPTVYYSCLVGVKLAAGLRTTVVWSEPGDVNIGYEAGGYNNAWDNPGGYSDPIESVCGTNEALYVFRERVSIAISGAVVSDWATAGTRANLSPVIGTRSPWATLAVTQGVVIVDADSKPWLMQAGAPVPTALWTDCRQTVTSTPRAALGNVQTVYDEATQSIVIGLPELGQTDLSAFLCYAVDDLQFCGVWWWAEPAQRIGTVVDANGLARLAHAGVSDGRLYRHGDLSNGPWNDALQSGTRYIEHAVVSASLGYDLDRELVFDQFEAAITGEGVSAVSVSYETPRGPSMPLIATLASTTGATWDVDDWDAADWAVTTRDQRVRVGLRGLGRWLRAAVRHSALGEPFGVTVFRVRAFAQSGNPTEP